MRGQHFQVGGSCSLITSMLTNEVINYATCYCRSVSSREAAVELTGMVLQRDLQ